VRVPRPSLEGAISAGNRQHVPSLRSLLTGKTNEQAAMRQDPRLWAQIETVFLMEINEPSIKAGLARQTSSRSAQTAPRRDGLRANDAEVRMAMPGDDIIERPAFNGTRAITIGASGEDVWPWIVQVGFGRAGFYSCDLLDNLGKPSAERIIPELQEVQVGTWIPMAGLINDETAFKVTSFAPNDWMLWTKTASTWAWRLIPTEDGRTRLISAFDASTVGRDPPSSRTSF
jgi:hypothetical protein